MIELTVANIIQIIMLCIMIFSWGMCFEVSNETREKAHYVYLFSLIIIWIIIIVK